MATSIDVLTYEPIVRYANKSLAWTVLWSARNQLKAQGLAPKLVNMTDTTIYADPSVLSQIEKISGKYSFRTKKLK